MGQKYHCIRWKDTLKETASKNSASSASSSVVVMEGLSNEMVPDVLDLSSKFENVETQTDLTEHEAYGNH